MILFQNEINIWGKDEGLYQSGTVLLLSDLVMIIAFGLASSSLLGKMPDCSLKKIKFPVYLIFLDPEENGLFEAGSFRIFNRFLPDPIRFYPDQSQETCRKSGKFKWSRHT